MVYRVFVEKKPGLDHEARALLNDARSLLGIAGLEKVRLRGLRGLLLRLGRAFRFGRALGFG